MCGPPFMHTLVMQIYMRYEYIDFIIERVKNKHRPHYLAYLVDDLNTLIRTQLGV